jgi:hypothetical protein
VKDTRTARRLPRPAAAAEECSRHAIKPWPGLPGAERIPDHMGRRDARQHVETPDFEDDKEGETSTIQDRWVLLKQIRSSPARLRAARPARRPEAAGGPAPATEVRSPDRPRRQVGEGTGHDGLCPRPASMRAAFPFPRPGESLPALRGTREFGSAKHATVMHVHRG